MATVFVLQHVHVLPSGEDDAKFIGVYGSRQDTTAAVERLRLQPGFAVYPRMMAQAGERDGNGFCIEEYKVGEDHWTEGFVSV